MVELPFGRQTLPGMVEVVILDTLKPGIVFLQQMPITPLGINYTQVGDSLTHIFVSYPLIRLSKDINTGSEKYIAKRFRVHVTASSCAGLS